VTWRDTKTAIIVFSGNQDTTGVVQTIKTAIEAHASYKRGSKLEGDTRLRSVFGRPDDLTREIIVTVLVVPIPYSELKTPYSLNSTFTIVANPYNRCICGGATKRTRANPGKASLSDAILNARHM
jgi:hypothetical protein